MSGLSAPRAKVLRSDAKQLRVRVTMPDLRFAPRSGGGRAWTQLSLPDTDSPQQPGKPGIPVVARGFAVPDGASLKVRIDDTSTFTLGGVDVFPAQPQPVDQATPQPNFLRGPFADRPFVLDVKSYASSRPFPAALADTGVLGESRDLRIGAVRIPAARYSPLSHRLTVLRSIVLTIEFTGQNTGAFGGDLQSPWERMARRQVSALLNGPFVIGHGRDILERPCGEQLLIITNPATRPAADQLRSARSAVGLRSRVAETGAAAGQIGTTTTQIRDYIRSELTQFRCIRPSYVAIMGDDKLVPTFTGPSGIPSDLEYSLRDGADLLPDVAVGRIIGNDANDVQTAVSKITTYESTPPTGAMLTRAAIAAQFQDDDNDGQENRTFIQFAETVARGLTLRGVHVDRIYNQSPGNNPQRFNDGTPLPASLQAPTFAWNGSGADVSSSWNTGDFMVVHRDHGFSDGWGLPSFGTANVDALTNGANLPVLLSINCSSGAYDYDDTSFAQRALVRSGGGAVGVFGDTRDSPSWSNSQIALGFVDAMLPSVLPAEGPAIAQRTGDALVNGKVRLAALAPPPDGATVSELYLWHYFGDPTMQMWGGGRVRSFDALDIRAFYAVYEPAPPGPGEPPPPPYQVTVTGLPPEMNGQPVSLLRNGEVVGSALASGGRAVIPALFGDAAPKPGELTVAFEGDGAAPRTVPVDGVPPGTLTQSCPGQGRVGDPLTVTGRLSPARGGATVSVRFTAPTGRSEAVAVTTASDGSWSASVTPAAGESGSWTAQASFAGDANGGPAMANQCTVPVSRRTSTLTQTCPQSVPYRTPITVTGALTGPPPGSRVAVTFTASSQTGGRTMTRTVTTDAGGGWSATSDQPTAGESGTTWTVSSHFDTDGSYAPADAGPCSVFVGFG